MVITMAWETPAPAADNLPLLHFFDHSCISLNLEQRHSGSLMVTEHPDSKGHRYLPLNRTGKAPLTRDGGRGWAMDGPRQVSVSPAPGHLPGHRRASAVAPDQSLLLVNVDQVECGIEIAENSRARIHPETLRDFIDLLRVDPGHIEAAVQEILLQEIPLALRGHRSRQVQQTDPFEVRASL
ncbi:hypothetical protein ABZU75_11960 [Streptosporangium sp. NPDC005286]|uniref:hypothetical protein n=1 Tax=Streptosporangium sp. NPDC005286 TaxID=3154463 RepID=UPI0033AC1482